MHISPSAERLIGALAIVALITGCVLVGVARSQHRRLLYISELGAVGMPSALVFQVGLLIVAAGIGLVALVVRHERSRFVMLSLWAPAVSLLAASLLFATAAAVPCSWGCPSLASSRAQLRDAVHVSAAVLAFAAGCIAMLQFASARNRLVARLSAVSGVLVAVIAAVGGVISLTRGNTDIGSTLEYVAAALGVAWLVAIVLVERWRGKVATGPEELGQSRFGADVDPLSSSRPTPVSFERLSGPRTSSVSRREVR